MTRTTIISIVILLTLLSFNLCIATNKNFLQKSKEQNGKSVSRYFDSEDYFNDSENSFSDSCSSKDDEERSCSCGCNRNDCDCSFLQTETNDVVLNTATTNPVANPNDEEEDDEEEIQNVIAPLIVK
jgi:hypothetical protein